MLEDYAKAVGNAEVIVQSFERRTVLSTSMQPSFRVAFINLHILRHIHLCAFIYIYDDDDDDDDDVRFLANLGMAAEKRKNDPAKPKKRAKAKAAPATQSVHAVKPEPTEDWAAWESDAAWETQWGS